MKCQKIKEVREVSTFLYSVIFLLLVCSIISFGSNKTRNFPPPKTIEINEDVCLILPEDDICFYDE